MNKCILIFSGYNTRAVISFCRVIKKYNIPFIIIAKSNDDSIFNTEYKKYVKYTREKLELEFNYIQSIFNSIKERYTFHEYIVLPSTEALNRFMLKYREEFSKMLITIPLVDERLYNSISDKYSFGSMCNQNGINIPGEINSFDNIRFPVVIKPRMYSSNSNEKIHSPEIILSKRDFEEFINHNNMNYYYIQEYIKGESFYLLYYFYENGLYESFSQKNLIQQDHGKSIIAAVSSTVHEKEISKKFIDLFIKLNYKGLVMVEIKYYNGRYYMIEANPRLWGPSQLFVDAGCTFFELFLKDLGFEINITTNNHLTNEVEYFWFGGIIQDLRENNRIKFHSEDVEGLLMEFHNYIKNDIYLREDTQELFYKEIK